MLNKIGADPAVIKAPNIGSGSKSKLDGKLNIKHGAKVTYSVNITFICGQMAFILMHVWNMPAEVC